MALARNPTVNGAKMLHDRASALCHLKPRSRGFMEFGFRVKGLGVGFSQGQGP